jgi:hypothetical protein
MLHSCCIVNARRCKCVRNYAVGVRSQNPPLAPVVLLPQTSDCDFGWHSCEEESCELRVPLFAPANRSVSPEQWSRYVASWNWDGLKSVAQHTNPNQISPRANQPWSELTPSSYSTNAARFHCGPAVRCRLRPAVNYRLAIGVQMRPFGNIHATIIKQIAY